MPLAALEADPANKQRVQRYVKALAAAEAAGGFVPTWELNKEGDSGDTGGGWLRGLHVPQLRPAPGPVGVASGGGLGGVSAARAADVEGALRLESRKICAQQVPNTKLIVADLGMLEPSFHRFNRKNLPATSEI